MWCRCSLAFESGSPVNCSILGNSVTANGFGVINQYSSGHTHSNEYDQIFHFMVFDS